MRVFVCVQNKLGLILLPYYTISAKKNQERTVYLEQYSFSKLSAFWQCKYQYFLTYIKREQKENNAFAQYGGFVHEILEKYAKGELEIFDLIKYYDDRYPFYVTKPFPYNRYVDLGEKYFEDGLRFFKNFQGLDEYEILGVEQKFQQVIKDDYILTGFIDLILKDKQGNLILHDWKSKNKFSSQKEKTKYARQLYLYSIYIKEKYGKYPDIMQFGMFRSDKTEKIEFSIEDFYEAFDWMDATVEEIRLCEDFDENTDYYFCNNLCDFRNICELKD